MRETSAYDFGFTHSDGSDLPLSNFHGKLLLIVNTASRCGFTPQYFGLQKLHTDYAERGLVILGVPSNDFGAQEPGSDTEIQKFCHETYAIDFILTRKEIVKGNRAHPFYRWAQARVGWLGQPRWNFHKYLVDTRGQLVDWFLPFTPPTANRLTKKLESLLPITI
ncbi:MAG: glutathione peroxidase [Alphaproteobacteria bacterium]